MPLTDLPTAEQLIAMFGLSASEANKLESILVYQRKLSSPEPTDIKDILNWRADLERIYQTLSENGKQAYAHYMKKLAEQTAQVVETRLKRFQV